MKLSIYKKEGTYFSMASVSFLAISPTALLSLIGLIYGPDKTTPTPKEDWHNAKIDVLIPAYNTEETIPFTLISLSKQTLKPRRIIIKDDGSKDHSYEVTRFVANLLNLPVTLLHSDRNEGKTSAVIQLTYESDADVLFTLDSDTALFSENYIERTVQELYQGVGIASSCGVITSLREKNKDQWIAASKKVFQDLYQAYPETKHRRDGFLKRLGKFIVFSYRELLYKFLERYIYRGESIFLGTIISPLGCAVAYRRTYLRELFEKCTKTLGHNLTTSEDIYIGFALATQGYRNIQVTDVTAQTSEPSLLFLFKQVFLWSSAYLQSCYYFSSILWTPFKSIKRWWHHRKQKKFAQEIQEKRKIKEAYRQAFGEQLTQKYGRPIGWFIFSGLLEKVVFPNVLLLMIIFKWWEPLFITLGIEFVIFMSITIFVSKGERVKTFFKGVLTSPLRYSILFFDLFVVLWFLIEVLFRREKKWRK